MVTRPGHSLLELIVALAVMGAGLASVASAALLGGRWTTGSVLRQEALRGAEATLDSLTTLPAMPGDGTATLEFTPLRVAWRSEPMEAPEGTGAATLLVRVSVVRDGGAADTLIRLDGFWIPPPTVLEP